MSTPAKDPRARNATATRAALLHAAMRRFTLLGYDRTTTRDIAADAGVNIALISRYFGSKEGLFTAVLRESADVIGGSTDEDGEDVVASVLDGLRTDGWADFGGEHPLLMLVRDSGESAEIGALRHDALVHGADRLVGIARADGRTATGRGAAKENRLYGETMLALVVGLLSIRNALPDGALASASPARLDELVRTVVDAVSPAQQP